MAAVRTPETVARLFVFSERLRHYSCLVHVPQISCGRNIQICVFGCVIFFNLAVTGNLQFAFRLMPIEMKTARSLNVYIKLCEILLCALQITDVLEP